MKNSSSWITWAFVALLLIFAGVASAVVPLVVDEVQSADDPAPRQESGPTTTTIDVSQLPFIGEVLVEIDFINDNIQGQTISLVQAFGIAFGVVLISVGALGLGLALITVIYSRFVSKVYADESYQASEAELNRREKARLKELAEASPPSAPTDPGRRVRNSNFIFSFLIVMLAGIAALIIGVSLLDGDTWNIFGLELSAAGFSIIVALVSAVILILVMRRQSPVDIEHPESDYNPVNWGYVWVIVTGFIVVGIGAGLAVAFSAPG